MPNSNPQIGVVEIDKIEADMMGTLVTIAYRVRAEVNESSGEILESVELNRGGPSPVSPGTFTSIGAMTLTGNPSAGSYLYEGYDWSPPTIPAGQKLWYQVVGWYVKYSADAKVVSTP